MILLKLLAAMLLNPTPNFALIKDTKGQFSCEITYNRPTPGAVKVSGTWFDLRGNRGNYIKYVHKENISSIEARLIYYIIIYETEKRKSAKYLLEI